jgi:phage shock protein A
MSVFDQLLMAVRANVNDWLLSREDPEQQVERTFQTMQHDLVGQRQAVASAIAVQKRTERQIHRATTLANEWYSRASIAMAKGDETLAKEGLMRRQAYLKVAEDKQLQVQQHGALVKQMQQTLQQQESQLIDARSQKEILIARARTAKSSLQVYDLLGNDASDRKRAFERLEEQVHQLEATVEINAELAANQLENQFATLESQQDVDAELQQLRQQLDR